MTTASEKNKEVINPINKKFKARILLGLLVGLGGAVIIIQKEGISGYAIIRVLEWVVAISSVSGAIVLLKDFLTVKALEAPSETRTAIENDVIEETNVQTTSQKDEVEDISKVVIESKIPELERNIIKKLSNQFKSINDQKSKMDFIEIESIKLINYTTTHITRLQNNSIVNLIIGIFWSGLGVYILMTIVNDKELDDMTKFIIYFIPRISTVIFFQIFGIFFLRLYKSNLEDIKYFQNELTNLNSKVMAMKVSNILNREAVLDESLKTLIQTERNFKILKDETMLLLEKSKIENEAEYKYFNYFKDLVDKIIPNSKKE